MPAQPDVGFHARCNLGTRHPSPRCDLFGRLAEACRAKGIALGACFNVGLGHDEGLRHRDWLVLGPDGGTYWPDRMDHFMRRMCCNTGYAEHLCGMIAEVALSCPVSGFFLDCMHDSPCVGVECGRGVRRVYPAPAGQPLPFVERDGYAAVTLPPVKGWAVIVFEDGEG